MLKSTRNQKQPRMQKEENKMNETLGKRIGTYRREMGMTQEEMAEKLGISAQAVTLLYPALGQA